MNFIKASQKAYNIQHKLAIAIVILIKHPYFSFSFFPVFTPLLIIPALWDHIPTKITYEEGFL